MNIDEAIEHEKEFKRIFSAEEEELASRQRAILEAVKKEKAEFQKRKKAEASRISEVYRAYIEEQISAIKSKKFHEENLFQAMDKYLKYHDFTIDRAYRLSQFCCKGGGTLVERFPVIKKQMSILESLTEGTEIFVKYDFVGSDYFRQVTRKEETLTLLHAGTDIGTVRWNGNWHRCSEPIPRLFVRQKNSPPSNYFALNPLYDFLSRSSGKIATDDLQISINGEIIFPNQEYLSEIERIVSRWKALKEAGYKLDNVVGQRPASHYKFDDHEDSSDYGSGYSGGNWGCS